MIASKYHPKKSSTQATFSGEGLALKLAIIPHRLFIQKSIPLQNTPQEQIVTPVIGSIARPKGESKNRQFSALNKAYSKKNDLLHTCRVYASTLGVPHEQDRNQTTIQAGKSNKSQRRNYPKCAVSASSYYPEASPSKTPKRTKPYQGSVVRVALSKSQTGENHPLLSLLRSPELLAIQEHLIQTLVNRGSR